VQDLKNEKIDMKQEIVKLEGVIQDLNAMIETTGYYQMTWEKKMETNDK
jgi:hypothetical protein